MTIRTVGQNSDYPTIAAAVAEAADGDIIQMEAGYIYERAELTVQNLTVTGGVASLKIDLDLGVGINDVTLAGPANIIVWDNAGSNAITGNDGTNDVHVSGGTDVVRGGDGYDQLFVDYLSATTVVAAEGTITADGGTSSVTFDGFDFVVISTGSGDDSLTTDDGDYMLRSGDGNNTIAVGGGRNIVETGTGNDAVTTGDGNNMVIVGDGDNTVTTGSGDDYVRTGGGDDTLKTGGGRDDLSIEGGIDIADAGAGHDLLLVSYQRMNTDVTVSIAGSLAEGYSGLMTDASGNNSVSFSGVENFYIQTGRRDDDVRVGGGKDTVWGGVGNDFLRAGAGNDYLDGGRGADTLMGGRGQDDLNGGRGADVFRFDDLDSLPGTSDSILDLDEVLDTIDLSRIDADVTGDGDQAFVRVDRFSGEAGEATLKYNSATNATRLGLDTDGDGAADIVILASGDHGGFSNFVL